MIAEEAATEPTLKRRAQGQREPTDQRSEQRRLPEGGQMGVGNMIALLGALVAMHMGTLLYVSKKIDTRLEEHSTLLSDAGKLISANAEGITKLQVLVEANRKDIEANTAGIKELRKTAADALTAAQASNKDIQANRKDIEANTAGIKELRKTAADALAATQANRKDVEANIEDMKDFRKTAAFQNQLLIRNNRSLGRIEGILGVQQIDETEEPPIPIYDVEANLEEDAEELEGTKERAEMTPDR